MKTHVDADDARPAGKPDECFYCQRTIGREHTFECVVPCKIVRLRATIEYEAELPRSWTRQDIEFHNEEKSCLFNVVQDIKKYSDRRDEEFPNTCQGHPLVEYLGISSVEKA